MPLQSLWNSGLSPGRCRFCFDNDSDSNQPKQQSEKNPNKRVWAPFRRSALVFDYQNGVFLCQNTSEATFPPHHESTFLCYDASIRLIPWIRTSASIHGILLDTIRPYIATAQYSFSPIRLEKMENLCNNHGHFHAEVSNVVLDFEENARNSNFLATTSEIPIPLLSISLSGDLGRNKGHSQPLFQSSIKRQMTGLSIAFLKQCITTELTFESKQDHAPLRFRVQSIAADRNYGEGFLYMILPSTRITLFEPTTSELEHAGGEGDKEREVNEPPDEKAVSTTARTLIETVRLLRNHSRCAVSRAFVLSGPPGVGKTFSIKTAYQVSQREGPTLLFSLGSMLGSTNSPGETSRNLERQFTKATRICGEDKERVAIIFIDECDALFSSDIVAGMVASLLDRATGDGQDGWQRILVLAATNRIDSIPSFLRRPGRFDKEIPLSPPTAEERRVILKQLLLSLPNSQILDSKVISDLAEFSVGYVPADLSALVRKATYIAIEEGHASVIKPENLQRAAAEVGASALRESSMSAPPKMTWDDIAGDPGGAKTALRQAIEWPRQKKEAFKRLGLVPPKGILLYGPPGCAKTTLARAAAATSGAAFVSLSPADVYASSYVGEAESIVRKAFTLARSASPCILFFDEVDSILGSENSEAGAPEMNRSGRGSSAEARVLSTFLNEMDGVDGTSTDGVLVLGATNRPWTLDAALLRPGRFDKVIYVPPPDYEGRLSILRMYCEKWKANDIDVQYLASESLTGSMTGAEIVGACRVAAMDAIRDAHTRNNLSKGETIEVKQEYLEVRLKTTKPLLSSPEVLDDFLRFERNRRSL